MRILRRAGYRSPALREKSRDGCRCRPGDLAGDRLSLHHTAALVVLA